MLREKLGKILGLPSPKDLGWSNVNALPLRSIGANTTDEHTWEDWDELVRKDYPIRYFLCETLPLKFHIHIKRPITDALYYLKCHLLPGHRYHKLDLRQPVDKKQGISGYRYGWIDSDTQMLYALFNILNNFVKHEVPNWYCPSEEDVQADPGLLRQRNNWLETKAIHYWWNVERARQQKEYDDLLHRWSAAQKNNAPETHQLWDELNKMEKAQQDKEDEMVSRLLKIRHSLWT